MQYMLYVQIKNTLKAAIRYNTTKKVVLQLFVQLPERKGAGTFSYKRKFFFNDSSLMSSFIGLMLNSFEMRLPFIILRS